MLEYQTRQIDIVDTATEKIMKKEQQLRGDKTEVPPWNWDSQHWNNLEGGAEQSASTS